MDQAQAEPQGELARLPFDGFERAVPVTGGDIGRPYFHAVPAGVGDELRGCIETHRLAVEQRTGEDFLVVALQVRGGVGDQGETGRMRFGKAVAAEALDLVDDLLGELGE